VPATSSISHFNPHSNVTVSLYWLIQTRPLTGSALVPPNSPQATASCGYGIQSLIRVYSRWSGEHAGGPISARTCASNSSGVSGIGSMPSVSKRSLTVGTVFTDRQPPRGG